jgi:DNA-binding NarL/FixJ family response regulator
MGRNTSAVRVLIVDDQPVFRAAARAVVEATHGFQLAGEAPTGEGALELLPVLEPHLVIMDVRMPGIGGIEAARLMAEHNPNLVVLLMSATNSMTTDDAADEGPLVLAKQLLSTSLLRAVWANRPGRAAQRARGVTLAPRTVNKLATG